MDGDSFELGRRIREMRRERRVTIEQLSELCGISPEYLRQIEGRGRIPSLKTFIMLCNALKADPSYLLQDNLTFLEEFSEDALVLQCKSLSPGERYKAYQVLHALFSEEDEVS